MPTNAVRITVQVHDGEYATGPPLLYHPHPLAFPCPPATPIPTPLASPSPVSPSPTMGR